MSFFSHLKSWQKGLVAGFLFTLATGIIYTIILIVFDIIFESKGLGHTCYLVTKTVQCTIEQAIGSRFGFLVIFLLVFGIPIAGIGALLGYVLDRFRIEE